MYGIPHLTIREHIFLSSTHKTLQKILEEEQQI